jgi:hypothetical protein
MLANADQCASVFSVPFRYNLIQVSCRRHVGGDLLPADVSGQCAVVSQIVEAEAVGSSL